MSEDDYSDGDDDISMNDASSSRSPSPVPLDATTLRAEGNDFFKSKAYGSALDKYSAAIEIEERRKIAHRKAKAKSEVNGAAVATSDSPTNDGPNADTLSSLYLNRAAALMALNRHAKAVTDCRKSIELQQEAEGEASLKSQLRFCRALIGCGQLEEAHSRLTTLPSSSEVRSLSSSLQPLLKSWSAVQRDVASGELRMASYTLEQLLSSPLVPSPPLAWKIMSLSLLYIRNDASLQQASSKVTDLLRNDPTHPEILLLRARVLFAQGDLTKTVQHTQAALRNDPDLTAARDLMRFSRAIEKTKDEGNTAAKGGRWSAAKDKYTKALKELGVEEKDVHVNGNGNGEAAAASSSSSSSMISSGLSSLHLTEGGSRQLRATLYSNRATANLKLKMYEAAISDCNSTLSLIASYSKAIRTRARASLALDLFDDAIKDFKEAIETATEQNDSQQLRRELQQAQMLQKRSFRKDHYKTLGLKRDAEDSEIKKAYRVASLKHHPDKGGDEAKFKEIGEAYQVLSDPVKRQRYDSGADDPESEAQPHPFGGGGGVDLSDLFGQGGMGGGMGGFPRGGFGGGGGRSHASAFHFG